MESSEGQKHIIVSLMRMAILLTHVRVTGAVGGSGINSA
jgi:hypothetical protein